MLDELLKNLDTFGQPFELFNRDFVFGRIARLDVGARKQLKSAAINTGVARPCGNQPAIDALRLGSKHLKAVRFRTVERNHKQHAVIITLACLVEIERRHIKPVTGDLVFCSF